MNLDLDRRLAYGFIFGIGGLTLELIGGLLGRPVSEPVVYALSGIVLATFGVQTAVLGRKLPGNGKGKRESEAPDES